MKFEPHKLHRTTDGDTSIDAAHAAESLRCIHFKKISNTLATLPFGGTAEQIADLLPLDSVQVNRRLGEMEKSGAIERTDERRTKRTGRKAIVWKKSNRLEKIITRILE